MKILLKMLMYEDGILSWTRSLSLIMLLAFLGVSIYLVVMHQTWANYDTFASLTGGGGTTTQLVNKFINSKYNSQQGSYNQAPSEESHAKK